MATSTLTQLLNYELLIIFIVPWEEQIYTNAPNKSHPPPPHTWVNGYISTFLSSWRKLQFLSSWRKLQLTSMNPLWVFSRFSRTKHNEFWSRHHCINSVTVQLLWPVISLVYNLQGGKLSTAKKIQLLQAPVASFVCAELFSVFRQLRSEFWHYIKINGYS